MGWKSINLFTERPEGRGLGEPGTTITETISLTAVTIIRPSNGRRPAISILLCNRSSSSVHLDGGMCSASSSAFADFQVLVAGTRCGPLRGGENV